MPAKALRLCVCVLVVVCVCTQMNRLAGQVGAVQAQTNKPRYQFDFGPGRVAPGYTQVLPATIYSKELGYGFEPGAAVSCVERGGKDALRGDFCTSDKPF